jgi:hypothetical protein
MNSKSPSVILILTILVVALSALPARGQTATEFTVGTTTTTPSIDGQWQKGEWDNAIEYKLVIGLQRPVTNPAFIRMVHDNSNLYGIIDVPSDNGTTYQLMNGDTIFGLASLMFYYGAVLNPKNQTQAYTYVQLAVNRTQVIVGVICNALCDPDSISAHSRGAASLSGTIHLNTKHRVWEFLIPMYPFIVKSPLNSNPKIGFDVMVSDSSGNNLAQHASLTFASTPVPEIISGQVILPVALVTPLILLFQYRRKRAR